MDYLAAAIIGLQGLMFLAIIGVYVWTFKAYKDSNKSLGAMYEIVNGHLQNTKVHVGVDGLVSPKVCDALHTSLKEKVDEISDNVKSLLAKS